jgi:hypothetical protein
MPWWLLGFIPSFGCSYVYFSVFLASFILSPCSFWFHCILLFKYVYIFEPILFNSKRWNMLHVFLPNISSSLLINMYLTRRKGIFRNLSIGGTWKSSEYENSEVADCYFLCAFVYGIPSLSSIRWSNSSSRIRNSVCPIERYLHPLSGSLFGRVVSALVFGEGLDREIRLR